MEWNEVEKRACLHGLLVTGFRCHLEKREGVFSPCCTLIWRGVVATMWLMLASVVTLGTAPVLGQQSGTGSGSTSDLPSPILYNCGGAGGPDGFRREWGQDPVSDGVVSGTSLSSGQPVFTQTGKSLPWHTVYQTARFFRQHIQYNLTTTPGLRYFLRFHFAQNFAHSQYASSNEVCEFTVTIVVDGQTFAIPLYKYAPNVQVAQNIVAIVEEFIFTAKGTLMLIDFDTDSGKYGFVNGIELVAAALLFDDDAIPANYTGYTEMRLNCGDNTDDTYPDEQQDRTMRWWQSDAAPDSRYFVSNILNDAPPFYLPQNVLLKDRSAVGSIQYNFTLDKNAGNYLVRLYFVEMEYVRPGMRVMTISINGMVAVTNYDIFRDAGNSQIAAAVDLIVSQNSSSMTVTLSTEPPSGQPKINGIEIIRIFPNPIDQANPVRISGSLIAGTFPPLNSASLLLMLKTYPGNEVVLSSWANGTNPCDSKSWPGVVCIFGAVASLDLSGMPGLGGEIPAELGQLTSLQELVLSGQNFEGSIPASLGNLTGLVKLRLDGNPGLTGSIPESLGSLPKLAHLDVSNDSLSGEVPKALLESQSLTLFEYSGNMGLCASNDAQRTRDLPRCSKMSGNPPFEGRVVAAILGAVAAACVLIGAGIFMYFKRCRDSNFLGVTPSTDIGRLKSVGGSGLGGGARKLGQVFTFAEIEQATNKFDHQQVLGTGGFGSVYKGKLPDGTLVAVKRGSAESRQGMREFQTEISTLSKLRHRHLVSLVGFCDENGEMILVYEFMANGSVRDHLYIDDDEWSMTKSSRQFILDWRRRLLICVGAARGLDYLHSGAQEMVIHRDVKSTNILLDDNFLAKVADFGLSKLGPSMNETHVSTVVKGSFGYLDPAYFKSQQLTEKSDVYSFGVVLLEILTAKPPISQGNPREQVSLVDWARPYLLAGRAEEIVDPRLANTYDVQSLHKVAEVALRCLSENRESRPSMMSVLPGLEDALILQDTSGSVILNMPTRPPMSLHRTDSDSLPHHANHSSSNSLDDDDHHHHHHHHRHHHPYGSGHHLQDSSSVYMNQSQIHHSGYSENEFHRMEDSLSGGSDPPSMASPLTAR